MKTLRSIKGSEDILLNFSLYAFFCKVIHALILITWTYSISMIIMTNIIPYIAANFASIMGINYKSKILDIIGLWIMPCSFMILSFTFLFFLSIKVLHIWLKKNFSRSIKKHNLKKQTKEKIG